ncbi:MAG TPA: MFS transporter [Patescibacteria group bacterium]|nr:MFS transporter [Patescibacteria group bacterium]
MKKSDGNTKGASSNVFFIGLLSFFGGISQDIFVPVLPLYLANVLHFDKSFIGLSEGLVTSSASIFRIVAGYLSDKLRKNKPLVFVGYFFSFLARPLLAILTSGYSVLGLRFLDGVGKGIKDSPKDALIADSTQKTTRGRGFGIVRALDTMGSVAGPLILFALLYVLKNNTLKYHYIFFATALPLVLTLTILSFYVKEIPIQKTVVSDRNSPLPKKFYIFLAIVIFFSIGNSSDTFLILRSQNLGVSLLGIPLVYALFNFVYASASIPLGSLSDKIGREKVILIGWICYALSYLGFAAAKLSYQAWILFAFYGIYYATTEGVAKAYIADQVASGHRGKAYGLYNSLVGLTTLPASFIAGFLWDKISPAAPFYFSAAIAALAVLMLVIYTRSSKREE